jgi:hypothetical protein
MSVIGSESGTEMSFPSVIGSPSPPDWGFGLAIGYYWETVKYWMIAKV